MTQQTMFSEQGSTLLNLKEAALWASGYVNRNVSASNISYLLQNGNLKKHEHGKATLVDQTELKRYYDAFDRESHWKGKLGDDLNWHLSFVEHTESQRTKHVHRLHPYKGKFIPQLVAYFLDSHTDEFKSQAYFRPGDIVLDPFCGSGTTLVQANELGIHAVGIDVSAFNGLITNTKVRKHDVPAIEKAICELAEAFECFQEDRNIAAFDRELLSALGEFNSKHFPGVAYRRMVRDGRIDEEAYAKEREEAFLKTYRSLVRRHGIDLTLAKDGGFLEQWYLSAIREELSFLFEKIKELDEGVRDVLAIVLSRTARSCRATMHADLGTLKRPVTTTYYCKKHGKICKPVFSIAGWWKRYCLDTIKRVQDFDSLRTDTHQFCLNGDSRTMDVFGNIKGMRLPFAETLKDRKIDGIFSSPPYVGLIDYHEQHAYAYEMFGLARNDDCEIGPLYKGQGKQAKDSYVMGISDVLNNCKKYLKQDYDVFLVANDKYDLYSKIAELAGMEIATQFKRPVLNRVEKDRSAAYAETIFHMKAK